MKNSVNKSCWIVCIFLLAVSCSNPKHTIMSVARIEPVAPAPIKVLQDTARSTFVLPKQSPQRLVNPKDNFEQSHEALREMLQGTAEPDFEKAVFLSENPYHNNKYSYSQFQQAFEIPLYCIESIIKANDRSDTMDFNAYVGTNGKFKMADIRFLPKEKKELYRKALSNWAIFKYITDTTVVFPFYNIPFAYVTQDPFGKNDWSHSQVMGLFTGKEQTGNCFSLTALYKILANRLNAGAKLCTAPQHIYIQHRDTKGDYYNVELATAGFPRDGTLQTLTHTTTDGIMSGIALRDYTERQSIGLCMVNLAKSYEHYFESKDDEFLLRCAETVLHYDSLNLNALLLKQQVLDNRVVNYARQSNNQSIFKLKQDKNIQQTVVDLEKHTALLYRLGYRQMPLDMQQIILSGNYPDSGFVDKNPSPFTTIDPKNAKTAKYHALYGGLFQEVFDTKPTETYGHFIFDTKTKQLKTIDIKAQENDLIDPVAFAYDFGARMYDSRLGRFTSTDPLASKYPMSSPYSAFGNNPIYNIEENGEAPKPNNQKIVKWFYDRKDLINNVAKKYNVKAIQLGLILYRENQNDMAEYSFNSVKIKMKESLAEWSANNILSDSEKDTWSPGVTQLQVGHAIRLKLNLTEDQYKVYKDMLLATEDGKKKYDELYSQAVTDLKKPEAAIDLLGKFVQELNTLNPNSSDEQIAKDYMRGAKRNRNMAQYGSSAQADEDWEAASSVRGIINDVLEGKTAPYQESTSEYNKTRQDNTYINKVTIGKN